MFTLDVMGFAPDQLHTLPFLVYNKILYKLSKNDEIDDKTRFMIHLIEETCVKLFETNNKFRRQIIKQINDFVNQNEVSTRTTEVVKSINILTCQYMCLLKVPVSQETTQAIFRENAPREISSKVPQEIFPVFVVAVGGQAQGHGMLRV